jgi:hypothetical protein
MGVAKSKVYYEDPLEFIRALLTLQNLDAHHTALQELEMYSEQLQNCTKPNVALLSQGRMLASNTLSKNLELTGWDQAQQCLLSSLELPNPKASLLAAELNACLMGSQSPTLFRTSSLYTADECYLNSEFIVDVFKELDLKLLNEELDPRLRAFLAYTVLVTAHPFSNANGRTARLVGDAILMRAGWLPVCYLSPIQSHVAVTKGGRARCVYDTVETFLRGLTQSYKFILHKSNEF